MIPTSYKLELSSLLSYPLGAKNVSDALDGVPQFDALSIVFTPGQDNPHRVESPFLVLRVNYSNRVPGHSASKDMVEKAGTTRSGRSTLARCLVRSATQ